MQVQTLPSNSKAIQGEHCISYAYPTSPAATALGYGARGCWLIEVRGKEWAVESEADALNAVKKLGTTPSRWSRDHHENIKLLGKLNG